MASEFSVETTQRFQRELRKLAAKHDGIPEVFRAVVGVLKADPYNRSHRHAIKKLEAVPAGEGQYRIRSGRFRFRYDIEAQAQSVWLVGCSLRREDSYR